LKHVLLAPCAAFEVDPQGGEGRRGVNYLPLTALYFLLFKKKIRKNETKLFLYTGGNFM
jgi:hypothetical protein